MIFIDQMIKLLSVRYLSNKIEILNGFLDLVLSFNNGFSFSIFSKLSKEQILILHFIALIVFYIFLYFTIYKNTVKNRMFRSLFIAGSLSNFIDRIFYGSVIDMFNISIFNYNLFVCNLSDIYLTIGVLFFFLKSVESSKVNTKFQKYNISKDLRGF